MTYANVFPFCMKNSYFQRSKSPELWLKSVHNTSVHVMTQVSKDKCLQTKNLVLT